MLVSQSVGVLASAAILSVAREPFPGAEAVLWGGAAGVSGVVGLAFFYRALSGGRMALIAPIAGVIGAAVPALVAVAGGEQLGMVRLAGLVAALVAIVLISVTAGAARSHARLSRSDFGLAFLAGLGFAAFFLCLDRASAVGGQTWWPLLAVRVVGLSTIVLTLAFVVARRHGHAPLRMRVRAILGIDRLRLAHSARGRSLVVPALVVAGLGDMGGNAFFVLANQVDALAVAVVLSSLYPIVTALLAAAVLGERLSRMQVAGVGLAALAAGLIGAG